MNNLVELAVQRKIFTLLDFTHCDGWVNMEGILRACREGTDSLTNLLIDDNAEPGLAFSVACTIRAAWEKSPRLDTILAWFMLDWPYAEDIAIACRESVVTFRRYGGFQQLHTDFVSVGYEGLRLLEAERFVDDITSACYSHPLETVPSFAAIRAWYTQLLDPGFHVRALVGASFSLDTVLALADVVMLFPPGWTGNLGVHAQLKYVETLMNAWWEWFVEKGYADAERKGLGNAVDELYECSPFVW
jgi:hypothetical protein